MSTKFTDVLERVQEYISINYPSTIANRDNSQTETLTKSYIKNFIEKNKIKVGDYSTAQLINRLYSEMNGYGFLTEYFERDDIEEININAYDDIKVNFSDNTVKTLDDQFVSPTHAQDIVKRLLDDSGIVIDKSNPVVVGHVGTKIRITTVYEGVVDSDVGVVASIRFIDPKNLTQEDFVNYGTATEEMLNFLGTVHKYGASTCFTGETGCGKSTLLIWLLRQIEHHKRLVTIEANTREMDLRIKQEVNGKMKTINNVVHFKTKYFEDEKKILTCQNYLKQL